MDDVDAVPVCPAKDYVDSQCVLFVFGFYYLRRRLVSGEGIVSLGVRVCVCPPTRDCTRRITLSGEGNVLYAVLSS